MTTPFFVVLAGINGAGKSTLADMMAADPQLGMVPYLNPDRLSAGYRQVDPALSRDLADMRALRHVAEEVHRLIASRMSFVSETVGANVSYRRYITMARRAGFNVTVKFVGLRGVDDSIARVAKRVRMGGHSIPEADIRRRWPAVHANLAWFAAHADVLEVIANADDTQPPRRVGLVRSGRVAFLEPDALPEVTRALASLARDI